MAWFLYLMGSFEFIIGILIILYTQAAIEVINGLTEKTNWRVLSLLPLILGVLLIISAWWSKYFWGILFLGTLATLKGLFYLFAPLDQINKLVDFFLSGKSEVVYRLWGLIAVAVGIFIIAAA